METETMSTRIDKTCNAGMTGMTPTRFFCRRLQLCLLLCRIGISMVMVIIIGILTTTARICRYRQQRHGGNDSDCGTGTALVEPIATGATVTSTSTSNLECNPTPRPLRIGRLKKQIAKRITEKRQILYPSALSNESTKHTPPTGLGGFQGSHCHPSPRAATSNRMPRPQPNDNVGREPANPICRTQPR